MSSRTDWSLRTSTYSTFAAGVSSRLVPRDRNEPCTRRDRSSADAGTHPVSASTAIASLRSKSARQHDCACHGRRPIRPTARSAKCSASSGPSLQNRVCRIGSSCSVPNLLASRCQCADLAQTHRVRELPSGDRPKDWVPTVALPMTAKPPRHNHILPTVACSNDRRGRPESPPRSRKRDPEGDLCRQHFVSTCTRNRSVRERTAPVALERLTRGLSTASPRSEASAQLIRRERALSGVENLGCMMSS